MRSCISPTSPPPPARCRSAPARKWWAPSVYRAPPAATRMRSARRPESIASPRRSGAEMKGLLLALLLWPLAVAAQVTLQEYRIPSGHRIHDLWADAAPGGPVWFSAQASGNLGIL